MKSFLPILVFAATLAQGSESADWRQFRGPAGNGTGRFEAAVLSADPAGNLAWHADLPGRGLSSPIVVGDRVFVTCSSGPKQERLHVLCFNATDGAKRWERTFQATGRTTCHEKTSVAAPSPASDGERVFALFSSNDLICLDLDGNVLWLRGLMVDYPNASNSLGMSSSLTVAGGVLIAQVENDSDSFTAGVDVRTGLNRWKLDRPKLANWTSPVAWKQPNGPELALLQSGRGLTAVNPADGSTVWAFTNGASTVTSTAPGDGILFVPSRGLTALKPAAAGAPPEELWRTTQLNPGTASTLYLSGRVFTLNEAGVLNCGEASTGRRLWQLRLKGPFSASPVGGGNRLCLFNENGLGQFVDISGSEGVVTGEIDLKDTLLSTPALAGNALYVRSDRTLWRFGRPAPRDP